MSCQKPQPTAGITTVATDLPDGGIELCTGIMVYRKEEISANLLATAKADVIRHTVRCQAQEVIDVLEEAIRRARETTMWSGRKWES